MNSISSQSFLWTLLNLLFFHTTFTLLCSSRPPRSYSSGLQVPTPSPSMLQSVLNAWSRNLPDCIQGLSAPCSLSQGLILPALYLRVPQSMFSIFNFPKTCIVSPRAENLYVGRAPNPLSLLPYLTDSALFTSFPDPLHISKPPITCSDFRPSFLLHSLSLHETGYFL